MEPFIKASRLKLRFDLQGQISTEQLWSVNFDQLVSFEEQLTEVVEGYGKSSRRKTSNHKSKEQELNELRLAIVTAILDIRVKEQEEAASAAETKAHNTRIKELIAAKQEAELANLPIAELEKLLK